MISCSFIHSKEGITRLYLACMARALSLPDAIILEGSLIKLTNSFFESKLVIPPKGGPKPSALSAWQDRQFFV